MKSYLQINYLLLLALIPMLGCTKVTPTVNSIFNSSMFLTFQEAQSVNDIDNIILRGNCKRDVTLIELKNSIGNWVPAASLAEVGSDLDCSDGIFEIKVLSSNSSLASGKIAPDIFIMQVRGTLKGIVGSEKQAKFTLGANLVSRINVSEGHINGSTGDSYKASLYVRDEEVKGLNSGFKTKVRTNH